MRGATQCATRLKQLVRSLRTRLGKVGRPSTGDAITQMILGIFSRNVPETKAREALDQLRGLVVDYNELRVIPPIEMTEMVASLPDARLKCEDLSRALNKVFNQEHEVTLERLRELPKKEIIEYLELIDGLDDYSRARIRLFGLSQHAIPLDEAMWAYARKVGIVDKNCSLQDAQAFLERRIDEPEALEVVGLLEKQAWTELGAAVRKGEVERIASIPPDRTARNMLQMVASGRATPIVDEDELDEPEVTDDEESIGVVPVEAPAEDAEQAEPVANAPEKAAKTRKAARKTAPKTTAAKKTAPKIAPRKNPKAAAQKKSKPAPVSKAKKKKSTTEKPSKRAKSTSKKAKSA